MSHEPPSPLLVHRALSEPVGSRLSNRRLTDRQRVALLLQGGALLSHLEQAGWCLHQAWRGARVTAEGELRVAAAGPGRSSELPQTALYRLVRLLFDGSPAGRGEARRAVRSLLEDWHQTLAPVSADGAVGQILEAAPFLWEPRYAVARRHLVAELRGAERSQLLVAGPGPCRMRLLRGAELREDLEAVVASERCRELWRGTPYEGSPSQLAEKGRWSLAAAAWEANPPQSDADRRVFAESLYSLGRFESALLLARRLSGRGARILQTRCHGQLGQIRAAKACLRRLEEGGLEPAELLDLAPTAVRVFANAGDGSGVRRWRRLVLDVTKSGEGGAQGEVGRDALALVAALIAAIASWDIGDHPALTRYLADAEAARTDPAIGWLYHRVRALEAMARSDGESAAVELRRALQLGRRRLRVFERGRLWNELGVARALQSDLAGAERACRHAVRLLAHCDGHADKVLALPNLAEVCIRRGRLAGVEEILERSRQENERIGNLRGMMEDAELAARYELARGKPQQALDRCRDALQRLEAAGSDWKRAELRVLAARALGWLGRRGHAAAELLEVSVAAVAQLEPEERPALWALADRSAEAVREAQELRPARLQELWLGVLDQRPLRNEDWRAVEDLEPFRAARLVFDCELVRSGCVPADWLGNAIKILRRLDARSLADRLEAERTGPWQALHTYLGRPRGETGALRDLFLSAGYPDVDVRWFGLDGEEGEAYVEGKGGERELAAPLGAGRLVLRNGVVDEVLRALFLLALQAVEPPTPPPRRGRAAPGIVGSSDPFVRELDRMGKFATQSVPVLILGETGTGKELVAREIHRLSPRRTRPFLAVNCAALAESLLLSDLFGHARGAFTGAERDHAGVFETARGGTVFLDEIGDLPSGAQGAFLRVLQDGEVRRLGESEVRRVDVRVVAATHRDLAAMVAEGTFREDLFYRLKVAKVELPPLRDRGLDVLELADHFLASIGDGAAFPTLSSAARQRLLHHPWPGNVRELRGVLELATALGAGSSVIEEEHLELPPKKTPDPRRAGSYHELVEAYRRGLVQEALAACDGNRSAAARRLGLSRQALSYLVRQLGLD